MSCDVFLASNTQSYHINEIDVFDIILQGENICYLYMT